MSNSTSKLRTFLLSLGWLAVAIWLYAVMLGLELDWNLVDWVPRFDGRTGILLAAGVAGLVVAWCLAGANRTRVLQVFSFVACLALMGVAIYVLPAEPLTHGLFARTSPSPLWYRAGRLLVMALPGAFWLARLRRR